MPMALRVEGIKCEVISVSVAFGMAGRLYKVKVDCDRVQSLLGPSLFSL